MESKLIASIKLSWSCKKNKKRIALELELAVYHKYTLVNNARFRLIASALPTSRKHSLLLKSQYSHQADTGCFILITSRQLSVHFADTVASANLVCLRSLRRQGFLFELWITKSVLKRLNQAISCPLLLRIIGSLLVNNTVRNTTLVTRAGLL
jgi:hypothetical protein